MLPLIISFLNLYNCSRSCDMTTCPQSNSRELVAILGKMSGCVEQAAGCCEPQLVVMDLRSYTVTLGNRAKGGGSECAGQLSCGSLVTATVHTS